MQVRVFERYIAFVPAALSNVMVMLVVYFCCCLYSLESSMYRSVFDVSDQQSPHLGAAFFFPFNGHICVCALVAYMYHKRNFSELILNFLIL